MRSPSTSTVQAPQAPVAALFSAGEMKLFAKKIEQ
jgi:hypothetical protein